MKVDPNSIASPQGFLRDGSVRYILECIRNNYEERLPPDLIIRSMIAQNVLLIKAFAVIYSLESIDYWERK